jgi:hypothetical protein
MGDPERDAQDGKKVTKKRSVLTNRKALACLVFILTCSLIGLVTVTTVKHDKSQDSVSLTPLVPFTGVWTNAQHRIAAMAALLLPMAFLTT